GRGRFRGHKRPPSRPGIGSGSTLRDSPEHLFRADPGTTTSRDRPRRHNVEGSMKEGPIYQAAAGGQQTVEGGGVTGASANVDPIQEKDRARAKSRATLALGLAFPRFFTDACRVPSEEVEWETRAAVIGNERGQIVSEQRE